MNKKEVSEIKSLFKRDGGAIDRICGCLIDGEQQIRMTFSDMFLSLSQEEIDKYFEIFFENSRFAVPEKILYPRIFTLF